MPSRELMTMPLSGNESPEEILKKMQARGLRVHESLEREALDFIRINSPHALFAYLSIFDSRPGTADPYPRVPFPVLRRTIELDRAIQDSLLPVVLVEEVIAKALLRDHMPGQESPAYELVQERIKTWLNGSWEKTVDNHNEHVENNEGYDAFWSISQPFEIGLSSMSVGTVKEIYWQISKLATQNNTEKIDPDSFYYHGNYVLKSVTPLRNLLAHDSVLLPLLVHEVGAPFHLDERAWDFEDELGIKKKLIHNYYAKAIGVSFYGLSRVFAAKGMESPSVVAAMKSLHKAIKCYQDENHPNVTVINGFISFIDRFARYIIEHPNDYISWRRPPKPRYRRW